MMNNILQIKLFQNFTTLLVWKIDRRMDKYTKNKIEVNNTSYEN